MRRLVGRPGAFLTSAEAIGYGIACAGFLVLRNLPGMWEQLSPLLGPLAENDESSSSIRLVRDRSAVNDDRHMEGMVHGN
ncbi:hypothetical protein ADENT20671_0004 [Actinomyces denticolens]|nr:hypothetical protein ADENT20671_0004 [Actinomyces denticolens]